MKLFPGAKLSRIDRLVLLVVLMYAVAGSVLESTRRHSDGSESILMWTSIAGIAVILLALIALWYGSRHGSISLSQFGFTIGGGMWVNLGIVALITVPFIGRIPAAGMPSTTSGFWMALGAFTEELVFRVYLLRVASILLSPKRGYVSWAVFLCAALFTAVHLFRGEPAAAMSGLFIGSLILGYVTYYTKSVLFAAYIHVLSNTAGELGFLGGGVTIAACLVISLFSSLKRRHSVSPVGLRKI